MGLFSSRFDEQATQNATDRHLMISLNSSQQHPIYMFWFDPENKETPVALCAFFKTTSLR